MNSDNSEHSVSDEEKSDESERPKYMLTTEPATQSFSVPIMKIRSIAELLSNQEPSESFSMDSMPEIVPQTPMAPGIALFRGRMKENVPRSIWKQFCCLRIRSKLTGENKQVVNLLIQLSNASFSQENELDNILLHSFMRFFNVRNAEDKVESVSKCEGHHFSICEVLARKSTVSCLFLIGQLTTFYPRFSEIYVKLYSSRNKAPFLEVLRRITEILIKTVKNGKLDCEIVASDEPLCLISDFFMGLILIWIEYFTVKGIDWKNSHKAFKVVACHRGYTNIIGIGRRQRS